MNIILLILAVIYLANAIRVKNHYVNESNGFDTSNPIKATGHFVGTFIACMTEGICWWYIIKNIIIYFGWS